MITLVCPWMRRGNHFMTSAWQGPLVGHRADSGELPHRVVDLVAAIQVSSAYTNRAPT